MTGEPNKGRTVRRPDDPLSYDMTDFDAAVDRMIDDVKTGRAKEAVDAELARVRLRYSGAREVIKLEEVSAEDLQTMIDAEIPEQHRYNTADLPDGDDPEAPTP